MTFHARQRRARRTRLRRHVGLLLGVATSMGCQALVGDYVLEGDSEATDAGSNVISASQLCSVEAERFVFDVDLSSDESFEDLTEYYDAANPKLVAHLMMIAQQYQDGAAHSGVTYLSGGAGIGKSFVARNALDTFADEDQCDIQLTELFTEDVASLSFEVKLTPDLATVDGEHVFNELPDIADASGFSLESMLSAGGCLDSGHLPPLVVIDGIDEVHDHTAELILESVDELALGMTSIRGDFLHILVAGRPEGFASWLTSSERNEQSANILDRFTLEPPRYSTAGDLAFRLEGYLDFAGTLEMYQDDATLDDYFESFSQAVLRYPFLTYSIGNLALGNIVIDNTAPGLDLSEEELKAGRSYA